ncbi:hypothetical protein ACHAW6_007507 [Cyclotella cf. meneghiniana]
MQAQGCSALKVYRLPFWCHDQSTLAHQRTTKSRYCVCHHLPKAMYISAPISVQPNWPHCPAQGKAYHLMTIFCSDVEGKTSIQTFCKQMQHQNFPLPLRQQLFCGQFIQMACRATTIKIDFLRDQCQFSKWHCRESDLGRYQISKKTNVAARARWPKCIHLALWPYAMKSTLHVFNTAPILND